MINLEKVNIDDKDMYLITDTLTMQRICLTRDDLGTLHHKIDVQYMSEDENYEESMQPLSEKDIDNYIEEYEEVEENEVLDTPSIADMLDKQARDRKQEEINNEMAYNDHKNKWST